MYTILRQASDSEAQHNPLLRNDPFSFLFFFFTKYKLVWLGRRLVLSFVLALLANNNPSQIALVIGILLGSLIVQFSVMPFAQSLENTMEVVSLATTLFTYGTQVAIFSDNSASTTSRVLTWLVVVVIFLVFIAFLITLLLPRLAILHRYILKRIRKKGSPHMFNPTYQSELEEEGADDDDFVNTDENVM